MLAKHLRDHDDLARRFDLALRIPGIVERTALALIIRMPELGQISREEAAALAGLALFDNDSGQYRGQRRIAGAACASPCSRQPCQRPFSGTRH